MANGPVIDILMYHSISDARGPTSIAPEIFAAQMQAIADARIPVVTLDDLLAARDGTAALPPQSVILTFDDAFQDFADTAFPILESHGFPALVYLPTDHVGRAENWHGAHRRPRPIMGWDTIRDLAAKGVSFGSHSVTHSDLTMLSDETLDVELTVSKAEIEDRLGQQVRHFAPPYGISNARVSAHAGRVYKTAAGTRLDRAGLTDDPMDLPRIEMFYFTAPERWRDHLEGRGQIYLKRRRVLRGIRQMVPGL